MTVLEGRVEPEKSAELKRQYDSGTPLPPQMLRTFLVQSSSDPLLWRVISIWRSQAALEEYRRSVATPKGITMFRAAGAEPSVSVWDVAMSVP